MVRKTRRQTAALVALFLLAPGAPRPLLASPEVALRFVDVAPETGLTQRIAHGGSAKAWIAEANGSGVAVLDYDDDGWMDILIVGGSTMPDLRELVAGQTPSNPARRVFLYRNLEGRKFEDVSEQAGLACPYWGTGANAADYDNDGDVDILITSIGRDLLFRNDGAGKFTEVGAAAGLRQVHAWHTGSSFGDLDADGDLDLYVAAYLRLATLPVQGEAPVCDYRGMAVFCGPLQLEADMDILYRNNGDGTFSDITEESGVVAAKPGYGFTPVLADFNRDGMLDIFVANDSSPNFLYINLGRDGFREDALISGLAYNADGATQADMGVCLGDYDSDGDHDLLTTTFFGGLLSALRTASAGSLRRRLVPRRTQERDCLVARMGMRVFRSRQRRGPGPLGREWPRLPDSGGSCHDNLSPADRHPGKPSRRFSPLRTGGGRGCGQFL